MQKALPSDFEEPAESAPACQVGGVAGGTAMDLLFYIDASFWNNRVLR